MADGALERGEGFVVIVYCGDSITFRALVSRPRFGEVNERSRTDSESVLNELELLLCFCRVLFLELDGLLGGLHRQICSGDIRCERQLPRSNAVAGVGAVRQRLLHTLLAR